MKEKRSSFSGSIGFVLVAAGSAVGVGNIWRFPYLCAKDGGGLFLLVYLVLVLTFGFVFLGNDGMASGPSLIFISLPKVFDAMGVFGRLAAIAFFLMMGFAAYSRAVSAVIRFSLYRVNRPESIETISFPTGEEIIPSDCGILLWS